MTTPAVSQGDRRRFAVLLSVLGVLVTVFLGRMVLGGGGDDNNNSSASSGRPVADAASRSPMPGEVKAKKQAAGDDLAASDSFEVFATRDPFEPPFNPTPTSPPDTTPNTGAGSVAPPTEPSGGGKGSTPATPPATEAPSFDPGAGESIAVLDVYTDTSGTPQARVRVGSTVFTVGVGDTFATSYKVVSLDEPCGKFLFGDSPFQLCEGEETIK